MTKRVRIRRARIARLCALIDAGRKTIRTESARRFLDLAFGG